MKSNTKIHKKNENRKEKHKLNAISRNKITQNVENRRFYSEKCI